MTIAFVPTWDTFWLGQVNAVIACLVALAIAAAEDRRDRTAGALLAAGTLIKLTPVVGLVALVAARRYRGVLIASCAAVVAIIASLTVVAAPDWWRGATVSSTLEATSPYLTSWTALISRGSGAPAGRVQVVLGIVLLALTLARTRGRTVTEALAASSLVPILAASIVWPHHAVMAIPAIAIAWKRHRGQPLGLVPLVVWLLINFLTFTPFVVPIALTALWLVFVAEEIRT